MKTPTCPCGSTRALDACCGRCHAGERAADAQQLMRSRYSAFVLRNEEYLLQTWHPTTRPASVSLDDSQKWLGLKIIEAKATGADTAEVEFIARYRIGGGSAARHHERSRFALRDGHWLYVDGDLVDSVSA